MPPFLIEIRLAVHFLKNLERPTDERRFCQYHSCVKERHCKNEEGKTGQRDRERWVIPLPLTFPYKLKILCQVLWQLALNMGQLS